MDNKSERDEEEGTENKKEIARDDVGRLVVVVVGRENVKGDEDKLKSWIYFRQSAGALLLLPVTSSSTALRLLCRHRNFSSSPLFLKLLY